MTYIPLHQKYRPKKFSELVGQNAIATTLSNAVQTKRIANAYMFTGPRGTGKTSSARILAKSLNCLSFPEPTSEPCEACDVCKGISKGYSLDVIEIDAASNSGVDNVRELIERSQFAPVQCRYKVFIIDEVHGLSNQAFNALLKTLEEPPKHVVFILATTDPQRVLPTIISRCQKFDFRRIDNDSMSKHLADIASKEGININSDAVNLIAQLSQGGLRDAESLLDQLGLYPDEVTPDRVWDLVGSVSENHLLELTTSIYNNDSMAVVDCLQSILDRGKEPLTILQNLANFYRDLLVACAAPNRRVLTGCTESNWQQIASLAKSIGESNILVGQKHLKESEQQLKNTTQPRLWLEVSVLSLMEKAKNQVVQIVQESNIQVNKVDNTKDNNQNKVQNDQKPENQQVVKPVNQNTVSNNDEYIKLLDSALDLIPSLPNRVLLKRSLFVIEVNDTDIKLGIKPEMLVWLSKIMDCQIALNLAFSNLLKKNVKVNIEVISDWKVNQSNQSQVKQEYSQVKQEVKPDNTSIFSIAKQNKKDEQSAINTQDWSSLSFDNVAENLAKMFDGKVIKNDEETSIINVEIEDFEL